MQTLFRVTRNGQPIHNGKPCHEILAREAASLLNHESGTRAYGVMPCEPIDIVAQLRARTAASKVARAYSLA